MFGSEKELKGLETPSRCQGVPTMSIRIVASHKVFCAICTFSTLPPFSQSIWVDQLRHLP